MKLGTIQAMEVTVLAFIGEHAEELIEGNQALQEAALEWVKENKRPKDVYALGIIATDVSLTLRPEDVFNVGDLEVWALDNGFSKIVPDD